ncbi:MAG: hypothetical protein ABI882_14700, partial [Acidobacteriota bacterium]
YFQRTRVLDHIKGAIQDARTAPAWLKSLVLNQMPKPISRDPAFTTLGLKRRGEATFQLITKQLAVP